MKTSAAWRHFQDAVLRHPLCRFTILPAAIFLAIWLVVPCLVLAMWAWGGREAWSADEIVNDCGGWLSLFIMLAVGLTGGLLTGRWKATQAGLITTLFALESYGRPKRDIFYYCPSNWDGTENLRQLLLLAVFALAGLWLFSLDRRKSADWPVLSRPLKLLGVAGAAGILVLAGWLRYHKAEWLFSLSAAIWFTVFLNLAWRLGETKAGRLGYGLFVLGTMALYVGLAGLLHDCMELWTFFHYSLAPLAAIGLAILSCLPWDGRPAQVNEAPGPAAATWGKPILAMALALGVFLVATLGLLKTAATRRLFAVCRAGAPEQVQGAITTWASVNARDITGQTPLMIAARTNPHAQVITMLQRAGADVNAQADGCTPLFDAIQNNQDPEVVAALIQAGAKVNAKIADGMSVLDYARQNKNPEIIKLLIQAGAK